MPAVAIPALHDLPLECKPGDIASICATQSADLALTQKGVTWRWSVYLAGEQVPYYNLYNCPHNVCVLTVASYTLPASSGHAHLEHGNHVSFMLSMCVCTTFAQPFV